MPLYEFFCDKCQKEVSLTLSMQERQTGHPPVRVRQPRATAAGGALLFEDVAKVLKRKFLRGA